MTLATIRTETLQLLGRADYAADPTELDVFINRGQQLLDRLQNTPHTDCRIVGSVYPGDSAIVVQDVRSIKELWFHDGESRWQAVRQPLECLLATYTEFAPPHLGPELVTNGRLATATADWTSTSGWTYSATNSNVAHSTGTTTFSQSILALRGGSYRVTFTVSKVTGGSLVASLGGVAMTEVSASGEYSEILAAVPSGTQSLVFTPSTDFVGNLDNISVRFVANTGAGDSASRSCPDTFALDVVSVGTGQATFDDSDYSERNDWQSLLLPSSTNYDKRGILFYPPADVIYTYNLYGLFRSPTLVNASDKSYWTEREPSLLATAAAFKHEQYFRNTAGQNAMYEQMQLELTGIKNDTIEEQVSMGLQMEG